jgi:hypothetical protein
MGDANLDEAALLTPGAPCIIDVSTANNPKGIWWGVVDSVERKESYLRVRAHITGGRVDFINSPFGPKPLYTNEEQGTEPTVNYTVYANTSGVREYLRRIKRVDAYRREAANEAQVWKDLVPVLISRTLGQLGVEEGPHKIREMLRRVTGNAPAIGNPVPKEESVERAVRLALQVGPREIFSLIDELKQTGTPETTVRNTVRNLMQLGVVRLDANMNLAVVLNTPK